MRLATKFFRGGSSTVTIRTIWLGCDEQRASGRNFSLGRPYRTLILLDLKLFRRNFFPLYVGYEVFGFENYTPKNFINIPFLQRKKGTTNSIHAGASHVRFTCLSQTTANLKSRAIETLRSSLFLPFISLFQILFTGGSRNSQKN